MKGVNDSFFTAQIFIIKEFEWQLIETNTQCKL
jgi:hypothetical protein